ncbi:MAG: LemA family protein [Candidatus Gracilibacteria bacterium]|nr:LemA family protein [Candidatus Peregrinibacteria bacterium]
MNNVVLVIISVLILLFLGAIFLFYTMKSLRTGVLMKWNDVMDALNLRLDKIPNLIETVKRFADDKKLFEELIELRGRLWQMEDPSKERVHGELEVANKIAVCLELAQKHPEIQKDTRFLEIKTELKDAIKEVDELTNRYNEKARAFNKKREFFLAKPLMMLMGFKRMPVLDFE